MDCLHWKVAHSHLKQSVSIIEGKDEAQRENRTPRLVGNRGRNIVKPFSSYRPFHAGHDGRSYRAFGIDI